MSRRRRLMYIVLTLCLIGLATVPVWHTPDVALALPSPPDHDDGPFPVCDLDVHIEVTLRYNGLPILWSEVRLDASSAKIVVTQPDPDNLVKCRTSYHSLFPGKFQWTLLSRPPGSTAELDETSTLKASLTPDKTGEYEVRFTGCPDGCEVPLLSGSTFPVSSITRDLAIDVPDEIVLPPETEPVLPPQIPTGHTDSDGAQKCGFLTIPDVLGAQWVTVNEWHGPEDYELLEGHVDDSHISRLDDTRNHFSQDHLVFVTPDLMYGHLRCWDPYQTDIEVEWESDFYPEIFRATRGDRASVWGYWIHDCAHNGKMEIHPPVMTAVHRPRPIQIPEDEGYGSNIYVPGIVTDLWISKDAGGVTFSRCLPNGLHQPAGLAPPWPTDCLPLTQGFLHNPINMVFEFNIYLPRDPQEIMAEIGRFAPPVPLYYDVLNPHGSGGPDPMPPEVVEEGGITYLKVTLDLKDPPFTEGTYSRRIVAGWVYPAPDNWDLKRWKLRINSMDVHDDADGWPRGDGDWRFWANTNNGAKEWTKLLDCNGCVHGYEDWDGRPWETDSADPERDLGPDLLLFPGQKIWVHTSGFEADGDPFNIKSSDATGHVSELLEQGVYTKSVRREECEPRERFGFTYSGCADYTLNFEILEGLPVGEAALSAAGQAIYDGYVVTPDPTHVTILPAPVKRDWNHPVDLVFSPNDPPVWLKDTELFKSLGPEPRMLTGMSVEEFREGVSDAKQVDPDRLDRMLKVLREKADLAKDSLPTGDFMAELDLLREALPDDLWNEYFGDLFKVYLPVVIK